MTSTADVPPGRASPRWRWPVLAVLAGLVAGALTSLGQQYLPAALHDLANSSTSWSVVVFALAWPARRWWTAVVAAVGAFTLLLAGYEITSELRLGFGMAAGTWALWLVLAAVAGPVLGLAAWWGRRDPGLGRAVATGLLAGLAVGEGGYGLTVVAASTSPVYWSLSVAAGFVAVAVHAGWARSVRLTAVTLLVAGAVAAAFLAVYTLGS